MNIKEVKGEIITKWDDQSFWRKLSQDEDVVQELLALDCLTETPDNYLQRKYGRKYYLGPVVRKGNEVAGVHVYERNYVGDRYHIKYKDIDFSFDCHKNGDIHRGSIIFSIMYSGLSHQNLPEADTFDEYYQQALDIIKRNKRKIMNYYNHEIKQLKQEYKGQLKRHNNILKWEKESENERD